MQALIEDTKETDRNLLPDETPLSQSVSLDPLDEQCLLGLAGAIKFPELIPEFGELPIVDPWTRASYEAIRSCQFDQVPLTIPNLVRRMNCREADGLRFLNDLTANNGFLSREGTADSFNLISSLLIERQIAVLSDDPIGNRHQLAELYRQLDELEITRQPLTATKYTPRPVESIPPRDQMWPGFLFGSKVSMLSGAGASGKTQLAITILVSLATGRDLLGFKPSKRRKVWYLAFEDDRDELELRLGTICKAHSVPLTELDGWFFLDTAIEQPFSLANTDRSGQAVINHSGVEELIAEGEDKDIIVIDPLVHSHSLPESSNDAVGQLIATLAKIASKTSAAVLLIHHTKKLNGERPDVDASRGASALSNGCRIVWIVHKPSAELAKQHYIEEEDRLRYIVVNPDAKANLSLSSGKNHWYELQTFCADNGTEEHGPDFLGVPFHYQPVKAFDAVESTKDLKKAQRIIGAGDYAANSTSGSAWAGYALADLLDLDMGKETQKAQMRKILKVWITNGALIEEEVPVKGKGRTRKHLRVGERAL